MKLEFGFYIYFLIKSKPLSTNPPNHTPQPLSHPKNPDREGKKKKNPLTLTDSRSEILDTVFLVKPDLSNKRWSGGDYSDTTTPMTKWAKI